MGFDFDLKVLLGFVDESFALALQLHEQVAFELLHADVARFKLVDFLERLSGRNKLVATIVLLSVKA